MKTKIYLLLLIASVRISSAQTTHSEGKPLPVKLDGIYECKDWELIDGKIENPAPAYYRFYADGILLFCHYQNAKDKDSTVNAQEIFNSVFSDANLNKIKDNVADDPADVYMVYNKFKLTAYKYQILPNGICFDILSEKPNCLGKPNLKVVSSVLLKTDDGNPADDHYFKFIPVN